MEQAPYTSPIDPVPNTEPVSKSSAGPVIGAVIVIIILALGGLYFWGAELNEGPAEQLPFIPGDDGAVVESESDAAWLPPSNDSDDAAAIEAELEATNMSAFENETNADMSAAESSF